LKAAQKPSNLSINPISLKKSSPVKKYDQDCEGDVTCLIGCIQRAHFEKGGIFQLK